MPSLEKTIVEKIITDKNNTYQTFIETGTLHGDTIFAMEDIFNKLYTIEIFDYNNTKNKYNGDKIKFILGDSSVVLAELLPNINENAIFFLDGHYSSTGTGFGQKHVPLYEELQLINKLHTKKAIIIIDDFRLFKTLDGGVCDWTNINKETVLQILKNRIEKIYHLPSTHHPEDRLIIELNII